MTVGHGRLLRARATARRRSRRPRRPIRARRDGLPAADRRADVRTLEPCSGDQPPPQLPTASLADTHPGLADFDPVLATGLAKNPNDRFASCSDFARAFNDRLGGSGSPSPSALTLPAPVARSTPASQPATGSTPAAAAGRSWVPVAVAAAVIVVLAGVALVWRPWENRTPTVNSEQTTVPSSPAAVPSTPSALPPPAPPPPPTLPASAIDRVLLSDDQLNNVLGTTTASGQGGMELTDSVYGMVDNSKLDTPPSCSGVVFAAEPATYADTDFEAIRHEAYKPHTYVYSGREPFRVEQTVAMYPSHVQAEAVLSESERHWNQCAGGAVREFVPPEDGRSYTFGAVQRNRDLLFVPMASSGPTIGAHACQRVLGVRFNVVVGARSCDSVDESLVPPYDPNVGWVADPQWPATMRSDWPQRCSPTSRRDAVMLTGLGKAASCACRRSARAKPPAPATVSGASAL